MRTLFGNTCYIEENISNYWQNTQIIAFFSEGKEEVCNIINWILVHNLWMFSHDLIFVLPGICNSKYKMFISVEDIYINFFNRFYYYYWFDTYLPLLHIPTFAGVLLVLEGIICPVISVSALTCFIRYIYYFNLQFLNNVIIHVFDWLVFNIQRAIFQLYSGPEHLKI